MLKEITVTNQYKGHHYMQHFVKAPTFCPNCGSKETWDSFSECYVTCESTKRYCTACKCSFYLSEPDKKLERRELGMIQQILNGVAVSPIVFPHSAGRAIDVPESWGLMFFNDLIGPLPFSNLTKDK